MKKLIYTIALLCSVGTLTAQNNLGVNQPNPQAKVHVTNTTNQKAMLVEDEANDATPFVIDSVGNVGVQTATPTTDLDVNGGIQADSLQLTNGASYGAVLTSDASGNAGWKEREVAYYIDQKSPAADGGTSTGGVWHTRELTFTQYENGTSITRSGNVITLDPGTYWISASAPSHQPERTRLVVKDQTSTVILTGQSGYAHPSDNLQVISTVEGFVELLTLTSITLSHYIQTGKVSDGLGVSILDGENEIFTTIKIEKIK